MYHQVSLQHMSNAWTMRLNVIMVSMAVDATGRGTPKAEASPIMTLLPSCLRLLPNTAEDESRCHRALASASTGGSGNVQYHYRTSHFLMFFLACGLSHAQ